MKLGHWCHVPSKTLWEPSGWVFRNKQDKHRVVTRNKARLVAKGYAQVAGLDFEETFRSEEHTSELQSHVNLVCRLLLEKKKKKKQHDNNRNDQHHVNEQMILTFSTMSHPHIH